MPSESSPTAPTVEAWDPKTGRIDLAAAFRAPFAPIGRSPLYVLTLSVLALVMILLPALYLAMVAGVGWLVYWHATEHLDWLRNIRYGRGAAIAVIGGYAVPLIVGVIGIVFMVKPIFARKGQSPEPVTVTPAEEPVLFGFVEMLCRVIRAPVPREIRVTCDANAAAGMRRGIASLFSNDLVLLVGLPLAGGLSLRQFAGVLAHEFGHFTQGAAMRADYIVQRTNGWFARVVYGRDAWDEALDRWAGESQHWLTALTVALARLFVWFSRRVLLVLMYASHAVSCFMSRQMEYDADAHEARLAGSAEFAATCWRLLEISEAVGSADSEAYRRWRERTLPDNLPMLAGALDRAMPAAKRAELRRLLESTSTPLFATHPSFARRIAFAASLEEPGVFVTSAPASCLFKDFESICRKATYNYYRARVGDDIFAATFVPTASVRSEVAVDEEKLGAADRFYAGALTALFPVKLGAVALKAPADPKAAASALRKARDAIKTTGPAARRAAAGLAETDAALLGVHRADALLRHRLAFDPKPLGLASASPTAADAVRMKAMGMQAEAQETLEAINAHIASRLGAAMSLLCFAPVEKRIPQGDIKRKRAAALLKAQKAVVTVLPAIGSMRTDLAAMKGIVTHGASSRDQSRLVAEVIRLAGSIALRLADARSGLHALDDPFAVAGSKALSEVIPSTPLPDREPLMVASAGEAAVERVLPLYERIMAELASLAEEVEQAVKELSRPAPDAAPTGADSPPVRKSTS